ncbi:MAG: glycosyltransferase [Gomphosphaeria aponina SAG 52.96 = DSM 107014]|uniref:Glycosyltransferase n=1 Tax=Gomphosphaeria aponina SAG 52.96 = DSM 107014 TaxID=1521640 RepID=A0A941GVM9_9CHRO|nr:glycosyltransferase [Gomphosphaeria aponina SAG 52.96 = DSM 107014]
MKIAYLLNQYPKTSHSFIRREIVAIEAQGINVARFSIRSRPREELVDEADKLEAEKTKVVLSVGILGLVFSLLRVIVTKPVSFVKTLGLTLKISPGSERGIIRHLAYLAEACVLLGWFSELDISLVHAHFGTNAPTVAMLCHVLGGPPYSFTVHGPEEFEKAMAIALPEKIKRSAFVVGVSSFGQSQLYRWSKHEQWSKIHLVHCGVDQQFLNYPHQPISEEPRLVCVGRLSEEKGQLLLIDAAGQLAASGLEFKLVLVGDGELRSQCDAAIIQLGLQNHVEITGWASNEAVRQQILASRALVVASFAEGLPVVIMEALALGRPVITTQIAGIPELVESGVCGWLVPSGSVEALSTAMKTVLELPVAKLEQMGIIGAERVAKDHDVAVEAQKLAKLFHDVVNKTAKTDE